MDLQLDRIRDNVKKATTEDLLDRVTVYRAGMEAPALDIIEQELRTRGVTDEQVKTHAEQREPVVLWEKPGVAWRCSYCDRPAVVQAWHWYYLWGLVPIFLQQVRCCREHQ